MHSVSMHVYWLQCFWFLVGQKWRKGGGARGSDEAKKKKKEKKNRVWAQDKLCSIFVSRPQSESISPLF